MARCRRLVKLWQSTSVPWLPWLVRFLIHNQSRLVCSMISSGTRGLWSVSGMIHFPNHIGYKRTIASFSIIIMIDFILFENSIALRLSLHAWELVLEESTTKTVGGGISRNLGWGSDVESQCCGFSQFLFNGSELSATERRHTGQSSPIPYGQQSAGPTCTQRRHKSPKGNMRCSTSILNSYITLYCPNIRQLNY